MYSNYPIKKLTFYKKKKSNKNQAASKIGWPSVQWTVQTGAVFVTSYLVPKQQNKQGWFFMELVELNTYIQVIIASLATPSPQKKSLAQKQDWHHILSVSVSKKIIL